MLESYSNLDTIRGSALPRLVRPPFLSRARSYLVLWLRPVAGAMTSLRRTRHLETSLGKVNILLSMPATSTISVQSLSLKKKSFGLQYDVLPHPT